MSTEFDSIIVGQGLAGSTLAWQLRWLGQRVAVIDRESPVTSSRVAAGLISPLTGKRLAVSWRFAELWEHAQSFYRRVQHETDAHYFDQRPIVRFLDSPALQTLISDDAKTPFVRERADPLDNRFVDDSRETVELFPSARLDVPTFLDATRAACKADAAYFQGNVTEVDVRLLGDQQVELPRFALRASTLIFCQGVDGTANPWFPEVVFEQAKGEILTLRIPGFHEQRVLHHDVWLAPVGQGRFLAGATFDREAAEARPTEQGRAEVLRKLAAFLRVTPEVVDHQAAFRPIVRGRLPVVGLSRRDPQIGYFNGLGSKGALRAPLAALQLANLLVLGRQVTSELRLPSDRPRCGFATPRRLTQLAHNHVSSVLREGDVVIDATAGNGLDTVFLANRVGPRGLVFSLDIQREAIERTRARLEAEGLTNVRLFQDTHASLDHLLPAECHGRVAAIMLNLGYLPRGDKTITTQSDSTLLAVAHGLKLLRRGGIMTVLAYTGHPGGLEETKALEELFAGLPRDDCDIRMPDGPLNAGAPRLYVITKLNSPETVTWVE